MITIHCRCAQTSFPRLSGATHRPTPIPGLGLRQSRPPAFSVSLVVLGVLRHRLGTFKGNPLLSKVVAARSTKSRTTNDSVNLTSLFKGCLFSSTPPQRNVCRMPCPQSLCKVLCLLGILLRLLLHAGLKLISVLGSRPYPAFHFVEPALRSVPLGFGPQRPLSELQFGLTKKRMERYQGQLQKHWYATGLGIQLKCNIVAH